jgi:hypothetical protein
MPCPILRFLFIILKLASQIISVYDKFLFLPLILQMEIFKKFFLTPFKAEGKTKKTFGTRAIYRTPNNYRSNKFRMFHIGLKRGVLPKSGKIKQPISCMNLFLYQLGNQGHKDDLADF